MIATGVIFAGAEITAGSGRPYFPIRSRCPGAWYTCGSVMEAETGSTLRDYAEVGIPNDGPQGLTLLSEATGGAEVTGRLGGENVSFRGRVLAEFNYGAR